MFRPLRFLQGAEGHLGGLPEDVLHVLPKLGGTFQVEGGSDLFTGAQALAGRTALEEGLECGVPLDIPHGVGSALGGLSGWSPSLHPRARPHRRACLVKGHPGLHPTRPPPQAEVAAEFQGASGVCPAYGKS